ncbi:HEAT repeat domain-containing protein [Roseimarinus sediminis]|jgi:hypothetical protein|uniref:HEAT repeat domain-containing protein n=1 Tax=Roseimarinus sediminis TaxID=1610899 RepID=UPI003D19124D
MTTKNVNDALISRLYSNTEAETLAAIDEIGQSGNSEYIPMLLDQLEKNDSSEVAQKIMRLLSEVKHTNAVPVLVSAIENAKSEEIKEQIVRACWENGLDYTNYLSTFINLLINGSYMLAFEAYTLIENTEGHLSETSAKAYIDQLKEALADASDDRKILLHSTIQFIPSLIRVQ